MRHEHVSTLSRPAQQLEQDQASFQSVSKKEGNERQGGRKEEEDEGGQEYKDRLLYRDATTRTEHN